MMIYLKHENHGRHIAYSESDAVICESNGWVRYEVDHLGCEVTENAPPENDNGDELQIEDMDKDALEYFALQNFGVDIDRRKGVEKLRTQVQNLVNEGLQND